MRPNTEKVKVEDDCRLWRAWLPGKVLGREAPGKPGIGKLDACS